MSAKRQALGRGLGALLSGTDDMRSPAKQDGNKSVKKEESLLESGHDFLEQTGVIGAIAAIDIELIEANPYQPRKEFDEKALQELATSIKASGIIQPLTVRKRGKKYQLISGERRLRASKIAGLTEVPVYIRMVNDNEVLEMALVENIQRENLNAIDIALSYQALMDACNYNQEELSGKVGKERSTVANYLRLLKLPAQVQLSIKDDKISMGHARAMINVEHPEIQLDLLTKITEKDLSVRQVEQMVRELAQEKKEKVVSKGKEFPEWCAAYSSQLSDKLQAEVTIKSSRGGKGTVQIIFSGEEELKNIFEKLNAKE